MAAGAPQLEVLLRSKEAVFLQTSWTPGEPVTSGQPATPAPVDVPVKAGFDASSAVTSLSRDGTLAAVTDADGVDIFDVTAPAAPARRSRIAQPGVVNVAFSPLGNMLVTWHRKRAEERE